MPRGVHKVKPVKAAPPPSDTVHKSGGLSFLSAKKTPIITVQSLNTSETSLQSIDSAQPKFNVSTTSLQSEPKAPSLAPASNPPPTTNQSSNLRRRADTSPLLSASSRPVSMISTGNDDEDKFDAALEAFPQLALEETKTTASSTYSRDSTVFSSASSIYSSSSSMYSFDDRNNNTPETLDGYAELCQKEAEAVVLETRIPSTLASQYRARPVSLRRHETLELASQPRSSLAKKAALYKNSRLSPKLPSFTTSLATWHRICRAARTSEDCYDSPKTRISRRGAYFPADASKDIKAMIVDDTVLDGERVVIVGIRGTQCQCLADWAVNKNGKPTRPSGFVDDEENACHQGFLLVARAMAGVVAAQLKVLSSAPSEKKKPSLLFTGHSAGGAVAALLYLHMLSTSAAAQSDLTVLAGTFSSIECVTFGAPPIAIRPFPKPAHPLAGAFLSFANEGDPILRLSNTAYIKSLGKLLTASSSGSQNGTGSSNAASDVPAAPQPKIVRSSARSAGVRRMPTSNLAPTAWEDLPLWPTPAADLSNAGDVVLLREKPTGASGTAGALVTAEEMSDVVFGDLGQHLIELYQRRVNELACAAIVGEDMS